MQTNEEDLDRKFGRYGKILDVFIPRDRPTMASRGVGFVTFYDLHDAEDAIEAMDGCVRACVCMHANVHSTSSSFLCAALRCDAMR
jgi:RNA recognition motif-containing protein